MTSHDLNAPVQTRSALTHTLRTAANPLALLSGLFAGALLALLVWLVVTDDPHGGEPVVVLAIEQQQQMADADDQDAPEPNLRDGLDPEDREPSKTEPAELAEAPDPGPEPLDLQFDEAAAPGNNVLPLKTAPIKGLTERTADGLLPRISADGKTPAKLYARPVTADQANPETAKIAIMVGGMGLSATSTSIAINRLPADVTLAFAPYAKGLQEWVHKARQNGHEVMLQLPMEPFDYPDNDPGPHTLLSSLPPRDNIRRLEWLMARFTGYFGVTNYMGAKFTASADALRPVLRQITRRGLVYVEDGSSARATSRKLARELGLTATAADLTIDAKPDAAAIDANLSRLETIALERGVALGVASALPVTMKRLVEWIKTLNSRGIILVPASATIALRQKTS